MTLPETITIIDRLYRIVYIDDLICQTDGSTINAKVDFVSNEIQIYLRSGEESNAIHLLWHEIVHAITHQLHIQVEEGDLCWQESAIDLLATGFTTVLADNTLFARAWELANDG